MGRQHHVKEVVACDIGPGPTSARNASYCPCGQISRQEPAICPGPEVTRLPNEAQETLWMGIGDTVSGRTAAAAISCSTVCGRIERGSAVHDFMQLLYNGCIRAARQRIVRLGGHTSRGVGRRLRHLAGKKRPDLLGQPAELQSPHILAGIIRCQIPKCARQHARVRIRSVIDRVRRLVQTKRWVNAPGIVVTIVIGSQEPFGYQTRAVHVHIIQSQQVVEMENVGHEVVTGHAQVSDDPSVVRYVF